MKVLVFNFNKNNCCIYKSLDTPTEHICVLFFFLMAEYAATVLFPADHFKLCDIFRAACLRSAHRSSLMFESEDFGSHSKSFSLYVFSFFSISWWIFRSALALSQAAQVSLLSVSVSLSHLHPDFLIFCGINAFLYLCSIL